MPRLPLVIAVVWLVVPLALPAQIPGQPSPAPLTTCAEVRELSRDEAALQRLARVRGVVTLVPADGGGSFVVHDGTGLWISVPPPARTAPAVAAPTVGDLVEVTGPTNTGHFAPTLSGEMVTILGRSELPAPRRIPFLGLESGIYDCQSVTLTGVVQAAESPPRQNRKELSLVISTATGRFTYVIYGESEIATTELVNAEVSVTGVFLSYFNSRREFLGSRIFSNNPGDLRILRAAPPDAFTAPAVTMGNAVGFSSRGIDLHRRRTRGTVTLSKPGSYFYIQEGRQALRINTRQTDPLQPGDVVEAAGFFQLDHHRAEMHESVFRRLGRDSAPDPEEITRSQAFVRQKRTTYAQPQDYDDYLVALRGRLIGVDRKEGEPLRLNLECDGVLVPAEFVNADATQLAFALALRPGSDLRVSGVCQVTFSESLPVVDWPTPVAMRLLVRGPGDVAVLRAASWWTPERLAEALGFTAVVLLVLLLWVVWLRRRVAQRSAELAEETGARRDAAVEFTTTLRERNRLAADLHDTTEQSLTGLAFQLEATGALQNKAPERSQHHLALARQLLNRSREDLRRSIWNLRATDLESKTLAEALQEVAANRSEDLAVRIVVTCEGPEHALPESVAGNLLLFAQEGITNALKHARATQIDLRLSFPGNDVALTISDDGIGFVLEEVDGPKEGHFGLQGMRERIKRLGGRFEISSALSRGTSVAAIVPR